MQAYVNTYQGKDQDSAEQFRRLAEVLIGDQAMQPFWFKGHGDPDGVVAAPVGALYSRLDGGANTTLYVKESGTDENGWVPK